MKVMLTLVQSQKSLHSHNSNPPNPQTNDPRNTLNINNHIPPSHNSLIKHSS